LLAEFVQVLLCEGPKKPVFVEGAVISEIKVPQLPLQSRESSDTYLNGEAKENGRRKPSDNTGRKCKGHLALSCPSLENRNRDQRLNNGWIDIRRVDGGEKEKRECRERGVKAFGYCQKSAKNGNLNGHCSLGCSGRIEADDKRSGAGIIKPQSGDRTESSSEDVNADRTDGNVEDTKDLLRTSRSKDDDMKLRKGSNYGLLTRCHCDVKRGWDRSDTPKAQRPCAGNPVVILNLLDQVRKRRFYDRIYLDHTIGCDGVEHAIFGNMRS
ncbi:6693_t:CDS:2, partial [Ambispora leptoticha]